MSVTPNTVPAVSKHIPWNKGNIVGAKPPLRPKHVWSIRTKLQVEGQVRDLALLNVAIDSKPRGCDRNFSSCGRSQIGVGMPEQLRW